MKITFIADNYPPERNAAAARVHERGRYWVAWGHQVDVITCAPNFPDGIVFDGYDNRWFAAEQIDGIGVVRVKTYIAPNRGTWRRTLDFLSFMVMAVFATLWQARRGRPDVVVATSPQFFAAVAGWLSAALLRRPFVMEISDLWPASIVAVGALREGFLVQALEAVELFLYRRAARIVAQTPAFQQDLLRRGVAPDKITVVLNGVELSLFSPREPDAAKRSELGLPAGHFVAGYLGTLGMAHGLENVLAAAELVSGEPISFLLMGPGAERDYLEKEIERRGLGNVILAPAQPKAEMPRAWSVCGAALVHLKDSPVFASVIPSKIFEAMAMGQPILLAAPAGEASSLLDREGCGVHVPPGDPGSLASAVRQLASSAALRENLARRAAAAAPNYGRERQANEMLRVLERAAGGPVRVARPDASPERT